jgi:hypothetical protein
VDDALTIFKQHVLFCVVLLKSIIPQQLEENSIVHIEFIDILIWELTTLSHLFYAWIVNSAS